MIKPLITITTYNKKSVHVNQTNKAAHIPHTHPNNKVQWVHLNSVDNHEALETLQKQYNLHPLLVEDISVQEQRAKHEEYDANHFLVIKELNRTASNHVCIIFGNNFVISASAKPSQVFDSIQERLQKQGSHIRENGPDYLAYKIADEVIDGYFKLIQETSERVEKLENHLLKDAQDSHLKELQTLKRELLHIQRNTWPVREALHGLQRSESKLISEKTRLYLRDVEDHTTQIIETVQTLRELTAGMLDIYLSSVGNKTNEVMRILTIIATIFIPLTFITGVYGMNFQYMPELTSPYGYWGTWTVMIIIGLAMLLFFKRKDWL